MEDVEAEQFDELNLEFVSVDNDADFNDPLELDCVDSSANENDEITCRLQLRDDDEYDPWMEKSVAVLDVVHVEGSPRSSDKNDALETPVLEEANKRVVDQPKINENRQKTSVQKEARTKTTDAENTSNEQKAVRVPQLRVVPSSTHHIFLFTDAKAKGEKQGSTRVSMPHL